MGSGRRQERDARLVLLRGGGVGAEAEGAGRSVRTVPGRIWLVGAGPGDPELMTLKAVRILATADVVVHDRLVGDGILDLIGAQTRRLYVGKRKSAHSVPQDEVNRLLVALALEGLTVVRLKGGDPFLFGRGGEEMLAARAAGIACDVVPGVSAALAASAAIGAPLTHRGLAQGVTLVTGHAAVAGEPDLDWIALARPNQTVAVYMGLSTAGRIAGRLMAAGRDGATPVAVVENVSRDTETRRVTTLAELATAVADLTGPAILIIGETAGLADVGAAHVGGLPVLATEAAR